jgi:hypothetical protein
MADGDNPVFGWAAPPSDWAGETSYEPVVERAEVAPDMGRESLSISGSVRGGVESIDDDSRLPAVSLPIGVVSARPLSPDFNPAPPENGAVGIPVALPDAFVAGDAAA